jgi:HEAT repeat protein
MVERVKLGSPRWIKGGPSPNPGGRKKVPPDVKALINQNTPAAIRAVVRLLTSKNEMVRLQAARELLDRGLGKPAMAEAIKPPATEQPPNVVRVPHQAESTEAWEREAQRWQAQQRAKDPAELERWLAAQTPGPGKADKIN